MISSPRSHSLIIDDRILSDREDFGLLNKVGSVGECAIDLGFGKSVSFHHFFFAHTSSKRANHDQDLDAGSSNDYAATNGRVYIDIRCNLPEFVLYSKDFYFSWGMRRDRRSPWFYCGERDRRNCPYDRSRFWERSASGYVERDRLSYVFDQKCHVFTQRCGICTPKYSAIEIERNNSISVFYCSSHFCGISGRFRGVLSRKRDNFRESMDERSPNCN